MKQKNNGIKRLLEFTGNKRGVLNLSRILSGISAIFILGPFLCVYFAAHIYIYICCTAEKNVAISVFCAYNF